MKDLNIGDKISFLDSVGGGIVSGFKDKNIVLVEDQDGFEVPVDIQQCVLVEKVKPKSIDIKGNGNTSGNVLQNSGIKDSVFIPTFNKNTKDLNIYLAFKRKNEDKLKSRFELFLINDSSYNIFYTFSSIESGLYNLCNNGELVAYSFFALDCIDACDVEKYSKINFQAIAFKRDKSFVGKVSVDVEKNINIKTFFSDNSFVKTNYFDDKINLIPLFLEKKSLSILDEKKQELVDKTIKINVDSPKVKIIDKIDLSSFKSKSRFKTKKTVKRDLNIIEVDLHINTLLDTTSGMKSSDMLKYQIDIFNYTMKSKLKNRGQKIVFIHGKGDGVLRSKIISELKSKYPNCKCQDAPFNKYGSGATMVIIG